MSKFPRLHIEFATETTDAVILKRGPTDWVHLLLWNTAMDTVTQGSWFHGRIYEDRCSLSPDGRLFAYFATKYQVKKTRSDDCAWVAISKPPFLRALARWPFSDIWGGRTSFINNQTLLIDCPHWESLRTSDPLPAGFTVLTHWIGRDAPLQTRPVVQKHRASFDGSSGIDQAGSEFQYESGLLSRNGLKIFDFNGLRPSPEPPPQSARLW